MLITKNGADASAAVEWLRNTDYPVPPVVWECVLYAADTVRVVRCIDCKYASFDRYVDGNVPVWDCTYWDSQTESDAYCSYGERIDDGNN